MEYSSSFCGTIQIRLPNLADGPAWYRLGPTRKGGLVVRIILVGLALAVVLSLSPTAEFQMAGDIVPGGDAAVRVHLIAGDIVPGGS